MGDIWRKVSPGDPLRIPAEVYNALLDVARARRAQEATVRSDVFSFSKHATLVPVRTPVPWPAFRGVVLQKPLEDRDLQSFSAEPFIYEADGAEYGQYTERLAVLWEPAGGGGSVAMACVSGITPIYVTVQSPEHAYAIVGPHGNFISSLEGPVRLIWTSVDSGEGWGIGLLGGRFSTFFLAQIVGYTPILEGRQWLYDWTIASPLRPESNPGRGTAFNLLEPAPYQVYPVPGGTRVVVFPWYSELTSYTWTYAFAAPHRRVAETRWLDFVRTVYGDVSLKFEDGLLMKVVSFPREYPLISDHMPTPPNNLFVGGNVIPGIQGAFMPAAGLWNGMPQWQHVHAPNWWIRWVPDPQQPARGRWVIGEWDANAQQGAQPIRGWAKRPHGQPADPDVVGDFPHPIGDADGIPNVRHGANLLQLCGQPTQHYSLPAAEKLALQRGEVVMWRGSDGQYRCGQAVPVAESPDPIIIDEQATIVQRFHTCSDCLIPDPIVQWCGDTERVRLLGGRRYKWQPNTYVRIVEWSEQGEPIGGGCAKVVTETPHRDIEEERWSLVNTLTSCADCGIEEPGEGCVGCQTGTTPRRFRVTLSGIQNRDPPICPGCSELNRTWVLEQRPGRPCEYQLHPVAPPCGVRQMGITIYGGSIFFILWFGWSTHFHVTIPRQPDSPCKPFWAQAQLQEWLTTPCAAWPNGYVTIEAM